MSNERTGAVMAKKKATVGNKIVDWMTDHPMGGNLYNTPGGGLMLARRIDAAIKRAVRAAYVGGWCDREDQERGAVVDKKNWKYLARKYGLKEVR